MNSGITQATLKTHDNNNNPHEHDMTIKTLHTFKIQQHNQQPAATTTNLNQCSNVNQQTVPAATHHNKNSAEHFSIREYSQF